MGGWTLKLPSNCETAACAPSRTFKQKSEKVIVGLQNVQAKMLHHLTAVLSQSDEEPTSSLSLVLCLTLHIFVSISLSVPQFFCRTLSIDTPGSLSLLETYNFNAFSLCKYEFSFIKTRILLE